MLFRRRAIECPRLASIWTIANRNGTNKLGSVFRATSGGYQESERPVRIIPALSDLGGPKSGISCNFSGLYWMSIVFIFSLYLQIELDFERLYPGATSSFYSRFPLLHNKLDKLISSAVTKDKAFQPLYDAYSHTSDGNKKDYLLCLLLPLIVQTNYRIKGSWKPSVRETQESFILEVEVSYKITIIRQILKNEQQKSESL